jgi:hypothetical protein
MDELATVTVAAFLGAVIWRSARGKMRIFLSLLAVIAAGTIASLASGEFQESWHYLLLDLGEAALGLVVGYAIAAWQRLIPVSETKNDAVQTWGCSPRSPQRRHRRHSPEQGVLRSK